MGKGSSYPAGRAVRVMGAQIKNKCNYNSILISACAVWSGQLIKTECWTRRINLNEVIPLCINSIYLLFIYIIQSTQHKSQSYRYMFRLNKSSSGVSKKHKTNHNKPVHIWDPIWLTLCVGIRIWRDSYVLLYLRVFWGWRVCCFLGPLFSWSWLCPSWFSRLLAFFSFR